MNVYLLSGMRTPIGSFLGSLASVKAPQLGGRALKATLEKGTLKTQEVDEVFMGNALSAGLGQAPARQAALAAGLSHSVPCTTLNKVCGSGLKSLIMAIQSIKAGDNQVVLAGGMENMSQAPHLFFKGRKGVKFGHWEMKDSMLWDGLSDAYSQRSMGNCAEECARRYGFTRKEQDAFAIESFRRSQMAIEEGIFQREIVPVEVQERKGSQVVDRDEGPFKVNFDKIPQLPAVFEKEGTITAANASTINDGAAAVALSGEKYRDRAKFRVVAYAGHAHEPHWFTTAPIEAMKKCLGRSGLSSKDIELYEINEAFAVVVMAALRDLELDSSKVNIYGGGIGLGHPIGASGARIVVTLMNAMENQQARYGMASLCLGGGEALAMILERL